MKPGQQFTFKAQSNPTTGYDWQVAVDPTGSCGAGAIKVVDKKMVHDQLPNGFAGVGGQREITFEVTPNAQRGTSCNVCFVNARPWEQQDGW